MMIVSIGMVTHRLSFLSQEISSFFYLESDSGTKFGQSWTKWKRAPPITAGMLLGVVFLKTAGITESSCMGEIEIHDIICLSSTGCAWRWQTQNKKNVHEVNSKVDALSLNLSSRSHFSIIFDAEKSRILTSSITFGIIFELYITTRNCRGVIPGVRACDGWVVSMLKSLGCEESIT